VKKTNACSLCNDSVAGIQVDVSTLLNDFLTCKFWKNLDNHSADEMMYMCRKILYTRWWPTM